MVSESGGRDMEPSCRSNSGRGLWEYRCGGIGVSGAFEACVAIPCPARCRMFCVALVTCYLRSVYTVEAGSWVKEGERVCCAAREENLGGDVTDSPCACPICRVVIRYVRGLGG